jgi:streptogramin lyase
MTQLLHRLQTTLREFTESAQAYFRARAETGTAQMVVEELEPRILHSADFSPGVISSDALTAFVENRELEAGTVPATYAPNAQSEQAQALELVFVDTTTPDYQMLLDDIYAQSGDERLEVVLLDGDSDGIEQITETLATRTDVSAIHIISHGSDGVVTLGQGVLDAGSIETSSNEIARWSTALTEDADLLIYGCDVAQSDAGRALIENLARLTGADVAASTDVTGNAARGGDWDLEYHTGDVETAIAFSTQLQQDWFGILPSAAIDFRETVDSDNNGKIDQIRMTADASPLNDDFSDINITVAGYTLDPTTPYTTGSAGDAVFYVNLVESGSFDTDATPTVTITANSKLKVGADTIATDSGVAADDTAAPVLIGASGNIAIGGSLFNTGEYLSLVFSEALNAAPSEAQLEAALIFANGATDGNNLPDINGATNPITLATTNVTDDTIRVTFNAGNTANSDMLLVGTHDVNVGLGTNLTDASPALNTANTASAALTISGYANAGGPYTIAEGDSINLDASASNPDSLALTYSWDINNDLVFGDVTGVSPTLTWVQLQSFGIDDDGVHPISVEVSGGLGGPDTESATITVTNVAPTLTTTGLATVEGGALFTLNLNAIDPGNDTVTSWTINWGDGTIETIAGAPSSATHTYTNLGFTYDILASAVDEDGTYLQNELLVASNTNDNVERYDTTGSPLGDFGPDMGLDYAYDVIIGPDGNVYVSGKDSGNVVRYDATTGAFIDEFVNDVAMTSSTGLAFGPDGNLYVASRATDEVRRYDASTGAFMDVFVSAGSGGLTATTDLVFGPDGDLYVASYTGSAVYRYDGSTGDPWNGADATWVSAGSAGLNLATGLTFGPDGNLYVGSEASHEVLRYSAADGTPVGTGKFVTGVSELKETESVDFGPDGHLYVAGWGSNNVIRVDGTTGVFIDEYITDSSGGLKNPIYATFVPGHQVTTVALIVDTTNDVIDGNTTSISALLGNKGADGFISLREAVIATNNTPKRTRQRKHLSFYG